MSSRWPRLDALAFGGDYNPEQWPPQTWDEDVALMREARVNLVSVGIFSWGMIEPRPGEFEFGWLDRVIDLLHSNGIAVDLATPTAAPPPWFLRREPEARPVTRDGTVLGGGSRQAYCPSSPAYHAAASRITRELAARYGEHPALVLWHVNNEYGAPTAECYCEVSVRAFRRWLRDRYTDLETLNERWGSAFWSQRYCDWDEIDAPRVAPSVVNPAQRLDFARFTSDALLDCFRRERDILHALSPGVPVTTNFMANNCKAVDYWRWMPETDVVSDDNYLIADRTDSYLDLAMSADLTRSLARGRPWLLMEHSTSAVSWQPRNVAKRPGEMRRNSLAHLARGADGLMFFQWRASRFGAEKHHSAMLPQGGTGTRIWREVVQLGTELAELGDLRGTEVETDIAMIWDWESWWALELEWRPSADLDYLERVRAWYEAAWRAGLTVDFAHPEADLSRYPMVVVPSLYLATEAAGENLTRYVAAGGTLLVSYFSGIVDACDRVYPGPYPGALRDVLGVTVEEWLPMRPAEHVRLTWDDDARTGTADSWAEVVRLAGAKPVLRYSAAESGAAESGAAESGAAESGAAGSPVSGGVLAVGGPAVTRHDLGAGRAWYVSARLDTETTAGVFAAACESAGLSISDHPELEVVRRAGGGQRFITLINHGDAPAAVDVDGETVTVPGGEVVILRRPTSPG